MKVMPTPQKGTLTLGCFYKIPKVITLHTPFPPNSKCDNPLKNGQDWRSSMYIMKLVLNCTTPQKEIITHK